MRHSAFWRALSGGALGSRTGGFLPWIRSVPAWCAGAVLLWSLYHYGAFLRPAKLVTAVAVPALGLVWAGAYLLSNRRHDTFGSDPPTGLGVKLGLPGWSLLALAVFGMLSAAWSLDPRESLLSGGILLGGLVFLQVGRQLGRAPRIRTLALVLLAMIGSVESLLAIVGYVLHYWRFALEQDGALTATGTFGYANALAGLLLLTLACTAALWVKVQATPAMTKHRALLAIGAAVQLGGLVLTRSRAAGAIIVVLILMFAIARALGAAGNARRNRCIAAVLTVVLLCGLVGGGVLIWREVAPQLGVSGLPPSGAGAGAECEDPVPMTSNSFRLKTWAAALEAFCERPFAGYGLGTFYEAYSPFKLGGHTTYAHNVVVQHLVELGALGTLLLVAFLAAAIVRPLTRLTDPSRGVQSLLLVGALGFVLHNLVDLTWYFPALFHVFTLVVGLITVSPASAAASIPTQQDAGSAPVVCS